MLLGAMSTPAISIHALREEGDTDILTKFFELKYFYPRPPRGGRLAWSIGFQVSRTFLSTPSARRATRASDRRCAAFFKISIHALREEGDKRACVSAQCSCVFLSTPSARRATAIMSRPFC